MQGPLENRFSLAAMYFLPASLAILIAGALFMRFGSYQLSKIFLYSSGILAALAFLAAIITIVSVRKYPINFHGIIIALLIIVAAIVPAALSWILLQSALITQVNFHAVPPPTLNLQTY